jgi:hypothetical protein
MMPISTTWSYKYNYFILTRGYYLVMFCHMPYVLYLIPHVSCMLHTSFIMPHISWLIYLVFHASSLMFQPCLLFILYLYYIYIIFILYLYYVYIISILYLYYMYIIYIICILYLYYIYNVVILYSHYIYTFIVVMIYAMVLYSADLSNYSGRPSISYSDWRIVPSVYSFLKDSLLQYARLCRGDTNWAIYICQPWPSKPLFFILELIPSANQRISYLMSLYRYLSVQTHRIEKQDVQRKRETKLGALLDCFLFIMLRSKLYPGWKTPLCLVQHQQSYFIFHTKTWQYWSTDIGGW